MRWPADGSRPVVSVSRTISRILLPMIVDRDVNLLRSRRNSASHQAMPAQGLVPSRVQLRERLTGRVDLATDRRFWVEAVRRAYGIMDFRFVRESPTRRGRGRERRVDVL